MEQRDVFRPVPVLPYAESPPGSGIRREFSSDGLTLTVTAPAGELSEIDRRLIAREAARFALLPVVTVSFIGLALAGVSGVGPIDPQLKVLGAICLSLFAASVYALSWRVDYTRRRDAYAVALRRSTVLIATVDRLLVDTTGPLGTASHEIPASNVRSLLVRVQAATEVGGDVPRLPSLVIRRVSGGDLSVLDGRERGELTRAAVAIGEVLHAPAS